MIKQFYDKFVSDIEQSIVEKPGPISPRKKFALELARLGSRLYNKNEKIAWCGVVAPYDILYAMGISGCFVEFIGGTLASNGAAPMIIEGAEQSGYAADTCGFHRTVMGAAEKGLIPEPEFLIATSTPCSGGLAVMEILSKFFKKDLFILNIPQLETDNNVEYLADQLKEMVKFVESKTGEKLNKDKLKEAMEKSNRATELMAETFKFAKKVPTPANGKELANFAIVLTQLFGRDEAIEIAQAYRDDFKKRVESDTSGVPDEKLRLMWIQNRIQFRNPLVKMLESQYQTAIVIDELNDITWEYPINPEDPYSGIAKRMISQPFNGKIDQRLNHLKKLAEEYKINGAINPTNWGCRQGSGSRGLIEDSLKEIGIPTINLEVDCVDSRNFSEGQIRTRMEAFIEMLQSTPSPW